MARLAALSILLLALAGCGGAGTSETKFEGERKNVAGLIEDLQTAGERKDEAAICDEILTRQLAQSMAARGSTCEAEVEKAVGDADAYDLGVLDVALRDATAVARVRNEGRVTSFELTRQGGQWRIASF
jgi:hypothetical protein